MNETKTSLATVVKSKASLEQLKTLVPWKSSVDSRQVLAIGQNIATVQSLNTIASKANELMIPFIAKMSVNNTIDYIEGCKSLNQLLIEICDLPKSTVSGLIKIVDICYKGENLKEEYNGLNYNMLQTIAQAKEPDRIAMLEWINENRDENGEILFNTKEFKQALKDIKGTVEGKAKDLSNSLNTDNNSNTNNSNADDNSNTNNNSNVNDNSNTNNNSNADEVSNADDDDDNDYSELDMYKGCISRIYNILQDTNLDDTSKLVSISASILELQKM